MANYSNILAEMRNNIYMGRDEARILMESATVRLFSELTLIVYCSVDRRWIGGIA